MRFNEKSVFVRDLDRPVIRRSHALVLGALAAWVPVAGHAQTMTVADVHFNDQLLMKPRGQSLDISRFERGTPVPAGDFPVDVYVNGNWAGKSTVRFVAQDGRDSAVPCFDKSLLTHFGLNVEVLPESARVEVGKAVAGQCANLSGISESASYQFDMSELRLDVSILQAIVLRNPQGYVSPELWDEGVTSATLGYNANTFRYSGHGFSGTQSFLGLTAGINIGSWHLRQQSSIQQATGQGTSYQNIATYLQHDIPSWKSQLILGDSYTDGAVFDSIGVEGVQLVTDDRMLPDSMRGYAPVIRGIATSNAHLTVTQNGNRLYETVVAPGPFEITDLYATGYGAVVAHPGGLTLANYLGDTIAVVEAKDAAGARVTNASGVRIDSRGYAVVPYLSPYALNTVEIDPKGIPLDVELKATGQQIAPRANSVVMVRFPTSRGRSAIISTRLPNGARSVRPSPTRRAMPSARSVRTVSRS
jgi:outer membrane usher protein FimD/PapC